MKRSIRVASCCVFAIACLSPSLAMAQFGFGFGSGSRSHNHGHNSGGFSIGLGSGGHGHSGGGITFGFGSGGHQHGYEGSHGHSHGPKIGIEFGIPKPRPTYIRPQPQGVWAPQGSKSSSPPVVSKPAPPPPPKPVTNAKPAATVPKENAIDLVARPITVEEIRAARKFFDERLKNYLTTLKLRLPAVDFDVDTITTLLVTKAIAADIQISLIDALQSGRLEAAEEIWIGIFPGEPIPFGMPRARVRFASFYAKFEEGGCSMADVVDLESDMMEMGIADEPCCGAESLLDDIRENFKVSQIVAQSAPGDPSASVGIPSGQVEIVYLPSMPDGSVVVLDDQTVMVGTGGVGKLRMDRGNVASALGYPQAVGQPAAENNSKLVRSGILLQNPTADAVNYVVDSGSFSMQSGYHQILPGDASRIISFDRGNGGKTAKYKLSAGSYGFVIKNQAWDLQKSVYKVDIDNSQNHEPFHCIVQGEHKEIPAGQIQPYKSDYPIVIRFDRGNGAKKKQVLHKQSQGSLLVAVNPADSLWDLFDPTAAKTTLDSIGPGSNFTPAF